MTQKSEMEIALEMVRRAALSQAHRDFATGGVTLTFMGLTTRQVAHLIDFYRRKTGSDPSTIEPK